MAPHPLTAASTTKDASWIAWDSSSWHDPAIPITVKLKALMLLATLPFIMAVAFFIVFPLALLLGRVSTRPVKR